MRFYERFIDCIIENAPPCRFIMFSVLDIQFFGGKSIALEGDQFTSS